MKAIFELSMLVDAKRLGEVLAQLDGKVYNLRHRLVRISEETSDAAPELVLEARPDLIDVPKRRGRARGAYVKSNMARQMIEKLKGEGVKNITTRQIAEQIQAQTNYVSTIMSELEREGKVRRLQAGRFEVL